MLSVDLSCATELGLCAIVLCKSGVTYTNQTGGISCVHPSAEGVLVPIRHHWSGSDSLQDYDCRPYGSDELLSSFAKIDAWLKELSLDAMFEAREGECYEAWVPVRIKTGAGVQYSPLEGLAGYDAILTYDNSD